MILVLNHKKNERIRIAENIDITVVEIQGEKVRLGIECPGEIPVHRKEVFDKIRKTESCDRLGMPQTDTPSSPFL